MATTPEVQRVMADFLAGLADNQELEFAPVDRENFARNSVRAAYYACYHAALQWATWRGYEWPDSWSSHGGLWSCWYKEEPETLAIHRAGKALMSKRVQADYGINDEFVHNAKAVLIEADELFALIKADQERVYALPEADQMVQWDKTAHPKPRVGRARRRR